jgi:dipeptidyl aminopeptidase/acylaminoacyl peptidase
VWSPDGRQLYFVSNRQGPRDVYVMEISNDGRALGEPRRVSTGLGVQSIGFSGAGQRLAYVTYAARANIWSLPVPARGPIDTSGARVVTTGNQIIESLRVSRDGRWLLYDSNLHLNADIFRIPVAGGAVERLTTDQADDFCPDLSPDGRELAYHSWHSGSRDIFVKKLDGGAPQQITTTPAQESYPIWSPDGSALAYFDQLREGGVSRGVFVIRRDRSGNWGTPVSLRAGAGSVIRGTNTTRGGWSPDGQFLAYPRQGSLEIVDTESRGTRVAYAPSGPADPAVEAENRGCWFASMTPCARPSVRTLPSERASSSSRLKIVRRTSGSPM